MNTLDRQSREASEVVVPWDLRGSRENWKEGDRLNILAAQLKEPANRLDVGKRGEF